MNHEFIQRLQEQRAKTWGEAKALLDNAAAEGRDLSAEENEQYQRMNRDLDESAARISEFEERAKANADAEAALERILRQQPKAAEPSRGVSDFRTFLQGEGRSFLALPESRDMLEGTDSAGGYTVPTTLYGQLLSAIQDTSGILQAPVTRIDTASGEPIDIPRVTAHVTASLTAEAAAITESTPTFDVVTLTPKKYAAFVQISSELLQDSAFDLEGYVARAAGNDCGIKLGAALHTQLEADVATGSLTSITADNLIDLTYQVNALYRNASSAAFLMNDTTLASVRKLKDTNGQFLWAPSLQVGEPDSLLGKPVYTDPNVDTSGTSADLAFFGDWSKFFVRIAGGIRFERSDDFAFQNDLVSYRVILRGSGALTDANAIKAITTAA